MPSTQASSLTDLTGQFADWLALHALPTWAAAGQTQGGVFREALTLDGQPVIRPRRGRVQTRQAYVYAQAGLLGWQGPWREAASRGLDVLRRDFARPDGLCRTLVSEDGAPLDETVMVYDQAFALLALATAKRAGLTDPSHEAWAVAIREGLLARPSPHGGVPESGDQPYQANAHMHLLEACLAWESAGGDAGWARLSDQIVDLALTHFIDAEGGFLREFFTADWSPAPGTDGRLVEPGHQFEWVWLLTLYGRARRSPAALDAARRLYDVGLTGVSATSGLVMDALEEDGSVRRSGSRLWPQTEWLKAALILAKDDEAGFEARETRLREARQALGGLFRYLTPEGLWRDQYDGASADKGFVDEPAPASSLYHIMVAFLQLTLSQAQPQGTDAALASTGKFGDRPHQKGA